MTRRVIGSVAAAVGLALVCAAQAGPVADVLDPVLRAAPRPARQVSVLNTQLRGIIDPDIEPSAAYGHVQIKLADHGDGTYGLEWQGVIFNPAGETFLGGEAGVVNAVVIDPDEGDGDEDPDSGFTTLFRFFDLRDTGGLACGVIAFSQEAITDEEHLPAEIAQRIIINPEILEARFDTGENLSGAIAGLFGSTPDPWTAFGFNPQPDPPGSRQARCVVETAAPRP